MASFTTSLMTVENDIAITLISVETSREEEQVLEKNAAFNS